MGHDRRCGLPCCVTRAYANLEVVSLCSLASREGLFDFSKGLEMVGSMMLDSVYVAVVGWPYEGRWVGESAP